MIFNCVFGIVFRAGGYKRPGLREKCGK